MREPPAMRFLPITLVLFGASVAHAADEVPDLKILSGAPSGESAWKMEIISFDADGMPSNQVPKSITLCMNPSNRFSGLQGLKDTDMADEAQCEQTVLENGAKRAKVSMSCKAGMSSQATITKESDKAFRVQAQTNARGQSMKMDVRYRHQGPCGEASTSAFGSGAIRGVELTEAQCAEMKAKMGGMDAETACASLSGQAKQACSAQMQQAMAMMKAACP